MKNKVVPSQQTQQEAMAVAKATQKTGQTKEQTKLIALGIEKGIAVYKKQQKEKSRQADKAKKKTLKTKRVEQGNDHEVKQQPVTETTPPAKNAILPWTLLIISWIGFIIYVTQSA
ncbi:DUF2956 domain-containing protein [Vibrio kasasachensis]|uniref:DUF2956 domain-containing protein n=1 Tax=Vibrio kasasachensis TaxID=2910248 RepID=UPI003D0AC038